MLTFRSVSQRSEFQEIIDNGRQIRNISIFDNHFIRVFISVPTFRTPGLYFPPIRYRRMHS